MLNNPLSYLGTKGKSISVIFMLVLFLPLITIILALFYMAVRESLISQEGGGFSDGCIFCLFCIDCSWRLGECEIKAGIIS